MTEVEEERERAIGGFLTSSGDRAGVFSAGELRRLQLAFDHVCEAMGLSKTSPDCEVLAGVFMRLARSGTRSLEELVSTVMDRARKLKHERTQPAHSRPAWAQHSASPAPGKWSAHSAEA